MDLIYILAALYVSLLWGISPIILKLLTMKFNTITIMVINGLLYFISLIIIFYFNYKTIMKDIPRINKYDLLLLVSTSVFIGLSAQLIYITLLGSFDSYIITALVSVSPLFTLILAYLFMKENITIHGVLGTILIVVGIMLISYNDDRYRIKSFLE